MTSNHFRQALLGAVICISLAFSGNRFLLPITLAQIPANVSAGEDVRVAYEQTSAQTAAPTVAGKWSFIFDTGTGDEHEEAATFQQEGANVTGKLAAADVQGTFKEGQLDLNFPYTAGEGRMSGTLKIKGKLEDDALKGTWEFEKLSGTFVATRAK